MEATIDALLDELLKDVRVDSVTGKIGDTPSLVLKPASADLHFNRPAARKRIRDYVLRTVRSSLWA